jgi:DNA adenine methylase
VSLLKAPFPYFGGKKTVASLVWDRLGDPENFIEPFAGSAAVLLARPTPPRIETLNDEDYFIANFWRATSIDPEAVATHADWPVNEADLRARHHWLILSDEAKLFRARICTDPDYFDVRVAGYWCWGLCCWIGSGWCQTQETAQWKQRPIVVARVETGGQGVNATCLSQAVPRMNSGKITKTKVYGRSGVHTDKIGDGNRPQLADAHSRGRGVHANDAAGTCQQRREWLLDWFGRLRDRLRTVRVCCGDWKRVCSSPSVTTRLGLTGIFLDPPYAKERSDGTKNRSGNLYANDKHQDVNQLVTDVRAYCLERGTDPRIRIALCGYESEGHEELETQGWSVIAWQANGGYGNRTKRSQGNAVRERIWFSPHCVDPEIDRMPLFSTLMD